MTVLVFKNKFMTFTALAKERRQINLGVVLISAGKASDTIQHLPVIKTQHLSADKE